MRKAVRGAVTVIAVAASLLMPAGAAVAQERSALQGTVLDELGGAIVGATVTARDAGGVSHTATADGSGGFALPGLPPGKYTVTELKPVCSIPTQTSVVVGGDTPPEPIRLTLKISRPDRQSGRHRPPCGGQTDGNAPGNPTRQPRRHRALRRR